MKTYKNLYPQICDFATLYGAYRRARCGKRDRVAVASSSSIWSATCCNCRMNFGRTPMRRAGTPISTSTSPNGGWSSAAPFRDRVVHHALCQVIEIRRSGRAA